MTRTWLEALRAPSSVSVDSKLGAEISGKTYAELPVFEVSKPPDVETIIVVLYQHCCFSSFIFSTVQDLTRFLVFNFEDSMNRDIFCKIKTYFIPGPVWKGIRRLLHSSKTHWHGDCQYLEASLALSPERTLQNLIWSEERIYRLLQWEEFWQAYCHCQFCRSCWRGFVTLRLSSQSLINVWILNEELLVDWLPLPSQV